MMNREISLLYRNFLHWNLSKTIIFAYALLSSIILSSPFIAGILFCVFKIYPLLEIAPAGNPEEFLQLAQGYIPYILISIFLFAIVLSFFIFFMSYAYYLLARVYQGYLAGTRTNVFANRFLHIKTIWNFTKLLSWTSLYMVIPVIIMCIGYAWYQIGSILGAGSGNAFFSSLCTLFGFIGFIYITIRLLPSIYLFVETPDESLPTHHYVKEGFLLTKGKVIALLLRLLPFSIVIYFLSRVFSVSDLNSFKNIIYWLITFFCIE